MFDHGPHVVMRAHGMCLIVKAPENEIPKIEYWGGDLGDLDDSALVSIDRMTVRQTPPATLDASWRPSLLPQGAEAWSGRPGFQGFRGNRPVFPHWTRVETTSSPDGDELTVVGEDDNARIRLCTRVRITVGGLVTIRHTITNAAAVGPRESERIDPLVVQWLEPCLPVPRGVDTLTSFTGRWPLEKQPVSTGLPAGSITRESRRGKTGHDAPWMFILSEGPAEFSRGRVWACHLAWSADATYRLDNMPQHQPVFGAGELLGPGEIELAPSQSYTTPETCFSYSDRGLDGMAERFHRWLRSMPGHVSGPRPLTLNTWEAVYFDHNEEVLRRLARKAADVGVERFVLDDGWFHERRDDGAGLGDWVVDPDVWPHGLDGLAGYVHELGMQFGLWFEPEMINLDSDLAREHPEWILAQPQAVPVPSDISYRNQYVLDLANPQAYEHVFSQMAVLVERLHVDYIKWDHNREVTEAVHEGHYGLHDQTESVYRLFDDLKTRFAWLEIESCSSGGARTDAGILQHADRIWASDSNDPRDRVDIQRWTELIVPPEMIGAHIGPSPAHSSGRATDLSYRAAISLEGSAGFEWNLLECTDEEIGTLTSFAGLYKELRGLLHSGTVHHADFADPALRARGVVGDDGRHAVWVVATVDNPSDALLESLHVQGLDPTLTYRIRMRKEIGESQWGWVTPQWLTEAQGDEGFVARGSLLETIGLQLPSLWPVQAIVLEFTAL